MGRKCDPKKRTIDKATADPLPLLPRFLSWLSAKRPDWLLAAPHLSAVAAEALLTAPDPTPAHAWTRMREACGHEVRHARAKKRRPTAPLVSLTVAPSPAGPSQPPALALDEVETLLRRTHGVRPRDATVFAAWLGGRSGPTLQRDLGLTRNTVLNAIRRARECVGLTTDEARALIGLARGERQADLAWGSWRSVRGARGTGWSRKHRAARGAKPVSASTVCQRQKAALRKLRGAAERIDSLDCSKILGTA